MRSILVATRNTHKTREIEELLGESFQVSDLSSQPGLPEIVEDGETFVENATIKALAVFHRFPGTVVLADDSGLEVDALAGAPGVFSARYAGRNATDQLNRQKLLQELERCGACDPVQRTGRFRCAIALAGAGPMIVTVEGAVEGMIVHEPRGTAGFGYDPLFQPVGYGQTFGQLPGETKNRISHRARALEALRPHLTRI